MRILRTVFPHAAVLFVIGWLLCEGTIGAMEKSTGGHPVKDAKHGKSEAEPLKSEKSALEEATGNAVGTAHQEAKNPPQAVFFGSLGGSIAMAMSAVGSAIGISKAGVSATHLGLAEPTRMLRGMLPVVMSELLSIYGLIVGVVISLSVGNTSKGYCMTAGFMHLAAGCCVGFCGLGAGYAIGAVGDACCRTYQRSPHIFTAMVLMLVFAEAIGLYGLIGALVLHGNAGK